MILAHAHSMQSINVDVVMTNSDSRELIVYERQLINRESETDFQYPGLVKKALSLFFPHASLHLIQELICCIAL